MIRLLLLTIFWKSWQQVSSWSLSSIPSSSLRQIHHHGRKEAGTGMMHWIPNIMMGMEGKKDKDTSTTRSSRMDSNIRISNVIPPSLVVASTLTICTCAQIASLPYDTSHHAYASGFENPISVESTCTTQSETTSTRSTTRSFPQLKSPIVSSSSMIMSSSQKAWMESLTPPTEDKPQIRPPQELGTMSSSSSSPPTTPAMIPNRNKGTGTAPVPIIEGMVYMFDKNQRPDPSDIIVLTVTSPSQPGVILAGAKYPVYKARLPFNFQMFDKNIVGGADGDGARFFQQAQGMEQGQGRGDLIIRAAVCPEESADGVKLKLPCDPSDSTYEAKSISKLVKVPGTMDDEVIIVRTPAALPLRSEK